MEDKKKKILIVDDEPDIVSLLKIRLMSNGYEVITAGNGNAGYEKAKSESPDLIMLDLMLPGIDGFQVCSLLKSDTNYSHIPIIILSAKSHNDDKLAGQKAGADWYLTKPFEAKEVLEKIKELLK